MQAPCSLVNCGLKLKPSLRKKACDRSMFLISRLTKIWRAMTMVPLLVLLHAEFAKLLDLAVGGDAFEVFHLVELAHLDLGPRAGAHGIREAARPLQGLLARTHL